VGSTVAVEGDTVATASDSTSTVAKPSWLGSWSAGAITETSYAKLSVGGVNVIHQARCTFTFRGEDTSTQPPTPNMMTTSEVVLMASTTILQKGASSVLVDGNNATDDDGNELRISANGNLTTA
jgi:hypothetical protein